MRSSAQRLALVTAAAPWLWFAGRDLHPVLDWGAVLLPAGAVGGSVVVLLITGGAGGRWRIAAFCSWLLFGMAAVVGPWAPRPTAAPDTALRLAAANIRGDNTSSAQVVQDLVDLDADVLVVSEVSPLQQTVARRLDDSYPHAIRGGDEAGVGVWSRFPLEDLGSAPGRLPAAARGVRVAVGAPSGRFVLYGLHLYRPSLRAFRTEVTMREQHRLVRQIDSQLAQERLPVVVAGDLNLPDRGAAYRSLLGDRVDAMRSSWTGPTSLRSRNRALLLRIDHLLLPTDWCTRDATRSPLTGSDHMAVAASVGRC